LRVEVKRKVSPKELWDHVFDEAGFRWYNWWIKRGEGKKPRPGEANVPYIAFNGRSRELVDPGELEYYVIAPKQASEDQKQRIRSLAQDELKAYGVQESTDPHLLSAKVEYTTENNENPVEAIAEQIATVLLKITTAWDQEAEKVKKTPGG
jgi:hypothetical protein